MGAAGCYLAKEMSNARRRGWTPPQKPEEWLVYLLGGAAGLYIACSLPSVLGPGSIAGATLLFLSGAALGVTLVLGGVFVSLFAAYTLLTKKESEPPAGRHSIAAVGAKEQPELEPQNTAVRQREHDEVVREMLLGAKPRRPPHSHIRDGKYFGWVWTIPSSKYDKTEAIINWPPATEGPKALATKWWGSIRAGKLYLARSSGLEKTYLVPVEEIDLAGAQIEVLREALKTKSQWWRKCPIQVAHPERRLLHSEASFALFAEGSAAKEQWYAALRQAAGSAPSRQAIEDAYTQFCDQARGSGALLRYPQVEDEIDRLAEAGRQSPAADCSAKSRLPKGQPGKAGWGRLFSRQRGSPEKSGSQRSRSQSPAKQSPLPPGFVNPMELDKAWMGKGAVPKHLAAPAMKLDKASLLLDDESHTLQTDNSKAAEPESAFLRPSSSDPSIAEPAKAEKLKAGSKSAHFPLKSKEEVSSSSEDDGSVGGRLPGTPTSTSGAPPPPPRPDSLSQELPEVPVEYGVNMMLARLAFDILRNPAVINALKSRIHRKLNELRIPDYIHGFEVVDIDLGHGVPAIHNLRAAPMQTSTIWPQLMFDLDFEGAITVVIETKLDVRDGAAWLQIDKAIHRLEGGPEDSGLDAPEAADSDDELPSSPLSPESGADEAGKPGMERRGFMASMLPLRQRFAKGIRQLAEVTADHLSKMQLRLRLEIKALKGPLYVWLPPPPGDRLWFSFVTPPQLIAAATPLVGGRLLKYSYQASRVSQWIASKLQSSITKNMVFPSCSDIPLPFLLSLDAADVGVIPASLLCKDGEEPGTQAAGSKPGEATTLAEAVMSKATQAVIETPAPGGVSKAGAPAMINSLPAAEAEPVSLSSSDAKQLPAEKKAGSGAKKSFWGRKKASPPDSLAKLPGKEAAKPEAAETSSLELQELKQAGQGPVTASTSGYSKRQAGPSMGSHAEPSGSSVAGLEDHPCPGDRPLGGKDVEARHAEGVSLMPSVCDESAEPAQLTAAAGSGNVDPAAMENQQTVAEAESPTGSLPRLSDAVYSKTAGQSQALDGSGAPAAPPLAQEGVSGTTKEATRMASAERLEAALATEAAVASAGHELMRRADPDGWLGGSAEVAEAAHLLDENQPGKEPSLILPDRSFSQTSAPDAASVSAIPRQGLSVEGGAHELSDKLDTSLTVEPFTRPELSPSSSLEGSTPGGQHPEEASLSPDESAAARELRQATSWQQRLNATGSAVHKNWEAFKTRNPNTMQQGKKFAGAMEKLRGQAQEQIRRTQEQMKKSQEQRKTQKLLGVQKPSSKEA